MTLDPWWRRNDADAKREEPWEVARSLRNDQFETRRTRAESALFLYYGSGRLTIGGATGFFESLVPDEPPFFNVIQAATDTKTAQIFRNQVRAFFNTDKGDTELQTRADGMMR